MGIGRRGRIAAVTIAMAAAVGAGQAGATPTGIAATPEGAAIRVTWTHAPGDATTGQVEVSNQPGSAPSNCMAPFPYPTFEPSVVVRCQLAFTGTVYVSVRPTLGTRTEVALPAANFDFTPRGPSGSATIRNRQVITCGLDASQWQRVDERTRFSARVVAGGAVRVEPKELSLDPILTSSRAFTYATTGADVGLDVQCEITAANGPLTSTAVQSYRVEHALPNEMSPAGILGTLAYPNYMPYNATKTNGLSKALTKAGALSKATRTGTLQPWETLTSAVTIFTTTKKADAAAGNQKAYCKALKRAITRASTRAFPKRVLACGRAKVAGARKAYVSITGGWFTMDNGARMIVIDYYAIGSAGNGTFMVRNTHTTTANQGNKTLKSTGARVATMAATLSNGLARE